MPDNYVRPDPMETTVIMTKKLYRNKKDTLDSIKKVTRKHVRTVSNYVSETDFPIQDNDILGTKVKVKYRRMVPYVDIGESVIYETRNCIVLRCDTTAPYLFIGWIENTMHILVGNVGKDKGYENFIFTQNGQQNEFLLIETEDFYHSEGGSKIDPETQQPIPPEDIAVGTSGTIIRADESNSDIVVIVEYLSDDIIRFVLADETAALLKNYVPQPLAPKVSKGAFINTMNELLTNYTIYTSSDVLDE